MLARSMSGKSKYAASKILKSARMWRQNPTEQATKRHQQIQRKTSARLLLYFFLESRVLTFKCYCTRVLAFDPIKQDCTRVLTRYFPGAKV